MRVFSNWLTTATSGLVGGWVVGSLLERAIEFVSYYEITGPNELQNEAFLLALPLSCAAGAVATWTCAEQFSIRPAMRLLACTVLSILGGLSTGAALFLMAKTGLLTDNPNCFSVPATRLWFCRGLLSGSILFSLIGFAWFVWAEYNSLAVSSTLPRDDTA